MAGARSSTRRKLVGRLRGRRNRRRSATAARLAFDPRTLARGISATLVLGVAVAAWPAARLAISHHSYFAVREVAIHGIHRLQPEAIRNLAGIVPGASIWDVDCRRAEERLQREPWVRAARVQRQLPHRVVIQIREERPSAILVTEAAAAPSREPASPVLYYVAAGGRIVAPVGAADVRDFPYVTGVTARDLADGEAFGPRALRHALRLLRLAARTAAVSEVHVDRVRGLTLLPVAPPVPIELGWGRYAHKLGRLPRVLALWVGREKDIAGLVLLFDGEVIVRTKASRLATPPRLAAKA